MGEIMLTIYTKPDCGLCDEMKEVIASLPKELRVTLREIDITVDPELEKKYFLDIPLLLHGDRCLARHRANEKTLLNKIRKLAGNGLP
ncbi:MAG: glutaredoxin family protein [Nitrospinota bacterium]